MTRPWLILVVMVVGGCSSKSIEGDPDFLTDVMTEDDADSDVDVDEESIPFCDGVGTTLWGGDCELPGSEWYHGEHTCPSEVTCGEISCCFAYSDWSFGTCICPEPSYEGDLRIVSPMDGAVLSMDDDVDPLQEGLQILVTVDTGCWMEYTFAWSIHLRVCGPPLVPPLEVFHPDSTGVLERVLDLSEHAESVRICAWPVLDDEVTMGDAVNVEIGL